MLLAVGGCPQQAFHAQIVADSLAGDLSENPDVKVTAMPSSSPWMLQDVAVPSGDTAAHLPPLSCQGTSTAPNPFCGLSPPGETPA